MTIMLCINPKKYVKNQEHIQLDGPKLSNRLLKGSTHNLNSQTKNAGAFFHF